ncbi:MAG: hypothetical protein M3209_12900 [Acidobacteriota bacterium]|nr:hypothetical protein [Acidobacteriota bacterium]
MNNALEKPKFKEDDTDLAPKVFGFAAVGVVAGTLALMGFPMTIIIFLALVGYFVYRAIARTELGEVRGIFEFYLEANEILRDDERRWYGYEIQEKINRGERILQMMPDPPPLVHFALGALYREIGNYRLADEHLSYLTENETADEKKRFSASSELRSYVRILRKLEREPQEAPQTMAAIRALERARRNRGATMLEDTRKKLKELAAMPAPVKELPKAEQTPAQPKPLEPVKPLLERLSEIVEEQTTPPETVAPPTMRANGRLTGAPQNGNGSANANAEKEDKKRRATKNRRDREHRPISEVLRDIYD